MVVSDSGYSSHACFFYEVFADSYDFSFWHVFSKEWSAFGFYELCSTIRTFDVLQSVSSVSIFDKAL